jgi:hypothetical protein
VDASVTGWHCPPPQVPPWQPWPQRPQFAASLEMSTHAVPQSVVVPVHWQRLATHCWVAGQRAAHWLQFELSLVRSTQAPEHFEYPELQPKSHVPASHRGVACATIVVHLLLHVRQLFGSVFVFVHVIPHIVSPAWQLDAHE